MRTRSAVRLVVLGIAAVSAAPGVIGAQPPAAPVTMVKTVNRTVTESIVGVRSSQPNSYSALSLYYGKWETYTAPPGTELSAQASGDVLALVLKGPAVKELAVFEASQGKWTTQALPEPAKVKVMPLILHDVVLFPVGKVFYVYRGSERKWSSLTLPTDEAPEVTRLGRAFLVQQGKKLYVYSVVNGTWSDGIDGPFLVETPFYGGFQSVSPKAP